MNQAKISQLALETAAKTALQPLPTATDVIPSSPVSRQPKDDSSRRYTIVEPRAPISRLPTSP